MMLSASFTFESVLLTSIHSYALSKFYAHSQQKRHDKDNIEATCKVINLYYTTQCKRTSGIHKNFVQDNQCIFLFLFFPLFLSLLLGGPDLCLATFLNGLLLLTGKLRFLSTPLPTDLGIAVCVFSLVQSSSLREISLVVSDSHVATIIHCCPLHQ